MKSPHEQGAIRDLNEGETDDRQNTKPEPLQQYRVACLAFRGFSKNTLQGFAALVIEPPGMVIQGCTVHEKNGKRWVNLPAKQYTGEDGVVRWQPLITIEGKSEYWHFQDLALAAIDRYLGDAEIVIANRIAGGRHELPF